MSSEGNRRAGEYEFNPASQISVGAIGQPGQRVFLLQASDAERFITIKLEKEQAAALAASIDTLLEEIEQQELQPVIGDVEPSPLRTDAEMALEPHFAAGQIGLGYDRESQMMVIVIQELRFELDSDSLAEQEAAVARIWVTCPQMRALSIQAREAVAGGRPICPLCQRPIDPEGHFCPRRNGHSHRVDED
jgi:uncharacterized repeat protein (TIGR03847 family)